MYIIKKEKKILNKKLYNLPRTLRSININTADWWRDNFVLRIVFLPKLVGWPLRKS